MTPGKETLIAASWLLGFDFDGTLADIEDNHSVSSDFFDALKTFQSTIPTAWGICTGRSLEFILEGMENANFPFLPDYLVTQERDVYYLTPDGSYTPDIPRNTLAVEELNHTLAANQDLLTQAKTYITDETEGEWLSIPSDPAGIIATSVEEIQHVVDLYHAYARKTPELDYQRNTIYLRFTHKDYCKGTAFQYLKETYNIPHTNTLVVGDNYNDLTMLNSEVAAHYGAPANALTSLKTSLQKNGGFITEAKNSLGVAEKIRNLNVTTL